MPPISPLNSEGTFRLRIQKYSLVSIIVAAIFYCVSLGMQTVHDFKHDLRDLLLELAIALIVGVYLMWTLERLNASKIETEVREYIHAVGDSFIKAVYGRQLPDELFQVVRASIFESSFVRNRYEIEIRIFGLESYAATAKEQIKFYLDKFVNASDRQFISTLRLVEFVVYYETTNVALKASDCTVAWELAEPLRGSGFNGLCAISSIFIDGKPQLDRLYVAEPNGSSHLSYEKKIKDVASGQTIKVEIKSYSVRAADDKEPWQVLTACKELTTTVFDHETDSDVLIWLDAPPIEGAIRSAKKDPQTNTARLRATQYLLPYQGVTVHWRPNSYPSPPPTPSPHPPSSTPVPAAGTPA